MMQAIITDKPISSASVGTVTLLTALSALGQFSSNIYLPSLPSVASELSTDLPTVQMTYTIFLAFFAVSQLVYGPVSDRLGRRSVLFFGLAVYIAGSVLCTLAPTIEVLLIGRAVQAIGAGAGVVLARAIIRDSFEGSALTKVLALTTIFFALVPGLTPLLGGLIEASAGWRVVFFATILSGAIVIIATASSLPETNLKRARTFDVMGVAQAYIAIARNRTFMGYAAASAFAIAAMSAFFGGSPAVFIEQLGVSPVEYGFYPPLAVSGFVIGGLFVRRVADRIPPRTLALIGAAILFLGGAISLVLPLSGMIHKHGYNFGIITTVTGLGILMPTAVSAALSKYTENVGAAAALLGFLQMSFGAIATICVGSWQMSLPLTAYPIIMTICGLLAVASIRISHEKSEIPGNR